MIRIFQNTCEWNCVSNFLLPIDCINGNFSEFLHFLYIKTMHVSIFDVLKHSHCRHTNICEFIPTLLTSSLKFPLLCVSKALQNERSKKRKKCVECFHFDHVTNKGFLHVVLCVCCPIHAFCKKHVYEYRDLE